MPTIAVDKTALFEALGQKSVHPVKKGRMRILTILLHSYTTEEFDELCFEFGKTIASTSPQIKCN